MAEPLKPGLYPVEGGYLLVNANGSVTPVPANAQPALAPQSTPFYKNPSFWSHVLVAAGTIALEAFVKNPQSQQRIGGIVSPILGQLNQTP